jgi:hypothetical protein
MMTLFLALRSMVGAVLALVWVGIVLISLFVLPLTGAMAVAARLRCRQCGHRFGPAAGVSPEANAARFPLRYAFVNTVILLPVLGVGWLWVRNVPGRETWHVSLTLQSRVVMAVLVLGLGVFFQALLWRKLRLRLAGGRSQALVLLLPTVVIGAAWLALAARDRGAFLRQYDPVRRSPEVLDRAGLAELPASAQDVYVYCSRFICSGEFMLRFAAGPDAIERFLSESPSLKGAACTTYSKDRMRLPAPSYEDLRHDDLWHAPHPSGHVYYDPEPYVPCWFQRDIRGAGRSYEVSWHDGKYQGELLIDDEEHVVCVRVGRF